MERLLKVDEKALSPPRVSIMTAGDEKSFFIREAADARRSDTFQTSVCLMANKPAVNQY